MKCHYIDVFLLQLGRTPLHYACWYGHLEIVNFLVSNSHADISTTDNVSNKNSINFVQLCKFRKIAILINYKLNDNVCVSIHVIGSCKTCQTSYRIRS